MCTPNLAKVLGLRHLLTMYLCISVTCTITCLDLIVILNVSLSIFDWIYRLMVVVAMVTAFVFIISMGAFRVFPVVPIQVCQW